METENSEYKVLKLVDGADVICKVVEEYADALTVERPFAVKAIIIKIGIIRIKV